MLMRLYIYLNRDIIKCVAPKINGLSFNIDFFEYSEKRGYSSNYNASIRPGFENNEKCEHEKREFFDKSRIDVSGEKGTLCNVQIEKRYINIEDVSAIKNNTFYYTIIENLPIDNRIKKKEGRITELTKRSFNMGTSKFIIDEEIYTSLVEIYENGCDICVIGYKINCLNAQNDVFKTIAVYID